MILMMMMMMVSCQAVIPCAVDAVRPGRSRAESHGDQYLVTEIVQWKVALMTLRRRWVRDV